MGSVWSHWNATKLSILVPQNLFQSCTNFCQNQQIIKYFLTPEGYGARLINSRKSITILAPPHINNACEIPPFFMHKPRGFYHVLRLNGSGGETAWFQLEQLQIVRIIINRAVVRDGKYCSSLRSVLRSSAESTMQLAIKFRRVDHER